MSALPPVPAPTDYPLSRAARLRYEFEAPSFTDFALARQLADRMNLRRDLKNHPGLTVKAGQLAAAALLDEIFAEIIRLYERDVEPRALIALPGYLDGNLGERAVAALLVTLEEQFPPVHPLEGRPGRVERLMRLHLANANPAQDLFAELFDDSVLSGSAYGDSLTALAAYFAALPPFGDEDLDLWQFLLTPLRQHPESLEDQLRFILKNWAPLLPEYVSRMLVHFDLIREENKPIFLGPGPAQVPDYRSGAGSVGMHEFEAFTPDREWMPRVVLLAKQTYVWLDQLSKKYDRHIYRLDQIPDEELDELAERGITGLWLIGVWQRSTASQKIKQMTGNPDAIASAYSLYSYDIAWEIGGDEGLSSLRERAARRGIRIASDMVPNHMAIDSRWVIENPDWFVSLPYPPFPHANFDTPDLSEDSRAAIHIEAGYFSRTDASVVFKRVDRQSGETRYIYHGNDGTSFPWNDTAQLNYLLPEVREAAIQTILHVARQFPIIRFDAAMTLAKRHYHRLWFPAPGQGGDIPSRAGRGLTPDEFDRLFPVEFWREVVDRIAAEAPDTLLLAEAFWLMEGYFVRTLGMHRVYNSAFMVMLRDEDNDKYRLTLKNTLEFDPDILGRFVNFMNNPDEKTAVEQFGKGDKYFGVCTLLATLPGLPMFGHGQIEGYAEKYGMEYPRAYWDEKPDAPFIEHHKRVIFPLLHRRALFAGSENFTLYDFWFGDGFVNEDVFAFSNSLNGQHALVIYNNRYQRATGWIHKSAAYAHKQPDGSRELRQRSLGEALGLRRGDKEWVIFRDNHSGLEYLRPVDGIIDQGLYVELEQYGCHVFLDWRQVTDTHGHYAQLAETLAGRGVPDVRRAITERVLEPVLTPLRNLLAPALWTQMWAEAHGANPAPQAIKEAASTVPTGPDAQRLPEEAEEEPLDVWKAWEALTRGFLESALHYLQPGAPSKAPDGSEGLVDSTVDAAAIDSLLVAARRRVQAVLQLIPGDLPVAPATEEQELPAATYLSLLWWATLADVDQLFASDDDRQAGEKARSAFDNGLIGAVMAEFLEEAGVPEPALGQSVAVARLLTAYSVIQTTSAFTLLNALLEDDALQRLAGVNRYENTLWFRKEGLEEIIAWLELGARLRGSSLPLGPIQEAIEASAYRLVRLLELVRAADSGTLAAPAQA